MFNIKWDHDNNRYLVCAGSKTLKIFSYSPAVPKMNFNHLLMAKARANAFVVEREQSLRLINNAV